MKLLKYLFFILLLSIAAWTSDAISSSKTSSLQPPLERMLSRKKRFLLMPKGGSLKFTAQMTKRMLALFPRGLNFVNEVAFYYPGPSSRLDLIPKRLRKPTTTTPKPKVTKPPLFVCIPGSLICYKAKPAKKPMKVQRIDENISQTQWIEPQKQNFGNYQKYENYGQKYGNTGQWTNWTKYGLPEKYEKYKWTPDKNPNKASWTKWTTEATQHQQQKWSTYDKNHWTQSRVQQYHTQKRLQRWRRMIALAHNYSSKGDNEQKYNDFHDDFLNYEPMEFPELEPHYNWQHYHSHRDRRQLFHQFEGFSKVLGFDMKSCIVRAICESKRYLLPPGYSLLQDILRLVFTLPTINGLTDDYSRAMSTDYETCDKFLRPKCPFNLLDWFINSEKRIH